MKTAVYYNNNDIRIAERPRPVIGPAEVLVKVRASGICGSDVMEWYRTKKAPLVLGHEIAGEVVETGADVKNIKINDRVFVSHHIPCNTCRYCLSGHHTACETLHTTNFDPGGFSQYIRVPALNVDRGIFVLPDTVSFEEGTFVEPLGCVIRGQRIAQFKPGQQVLILGGGISGILHLLLAKACGAGSVTVTDVVDSRLKTAQRFGADFVIDARQDVAAAYKKQYGFFADLVIVCTGALPAFKQALQSVERGGTILCFATTEPQTNLEIPLNDFWRNEITLLPSYGAAPSDLNTAIELLRNKRIPAKEMITHRLPLDETGRGFKLVSEGTESLKVIIEPF
ncbi:MAG: zinc-dependent dehydrogenase [Elusimicrobia bacterium]|nr:zinc-dependent dehydrogenase [Elusimicrobiota bacterium]